MKNLSNLLFNVLIGLFISAIAGFNPLLGIGGANAAGLVLGKSHSMSSTNANAGLAKEIWIPDLMEKFYPDWSFLKEAKDMSQWVDNDTINLAEAGIDPNVLVNNTSYPVAFAERSDNALAISLDVFDTEGTVLRNAEAVELAYDKRASVLMGHRNALNNKIAKIAAHAYTPTADGTYTPVLASTSSKNFTLGGHTFKRLSFDDIFELKAKFYMMDINESDLVFVLNPLHEIHLWQEDKDLFKAIMQSGNVLGMKSYKYSQTAVFDKDTNQKKAFGAVAAVTDQISSFVFHKGEVMQALGTADMFERLKDPEQKGDIINFQLRAKAMPIRNKFFGAIYSDFVS